MKPLPLDKILQSQGFGSRKWCRQLISNREVSVNGALCTDYASALDPGDLTLTVFGEDWRYRQQVFLALNKPANFECSRKPSHHPGILSILPEQFRWREVQPVGRLDHDTTGLLLLSDDGAFIHAQSSPKRHVPKRYLATTAEVIDAGLIEQLLNGVQLHDEPAPLTAQECQQVGSHQLEIVLEQGKYHQVKRMLAAAGNHCAALQRIAIGGLTLAHLELALGEWCYLEVAQLALLAGEELSTSLATHQIVS